MSNQNPEVKIDTKCSVNINNIIDDILELIESDAKLKLNIEDRYETAIGINKILNNHLQQG